MKTILVDAVNTFVLQEGIDKALYELLESYPNNKIILTNANDEQMEKFGLTNMPYEVFTLEHNPDKPDPIYFKTLLKKYNFSPDEVIYFEHNPGAVKSAQSVGITSYHFDHEKRDVEALKEFIDTHLNTQ